jgi:hypothetical protein
MSWCNWCNWCNWCKNDYQDINEVEDKIIPDMINNTEGLFLELTNHYLIVNIDTRFKLEVKIFDCELNKITVKKLSEINNKYKNSIVQCLWMDLGTFKKDKSILINRLAKVYIIDENNKVIIDLAKEINSI